MKVKLLVGRGGIGFVQNAGDVIEVDDDEGKRMIFANQAEPVKATRKTATKKPDENTSVE